MSAVDILSPEACALLAELHDAFEPERARLLEAREQPRSLAFAEPPAGDWTVAPPPAALADRRVEIIVPAAPEPVAGALRSGAHVLVADLEDSLAPSWRNVLGGQRTIRELADGGLGSMAMLVRPRGWHLVEAHHEVDRRPVSAALFDAGLFAFHCARTLADAGGAGPCLVLPKLESHREARLWSDALGLLEERLELPHASIRTSILVETLPAAFELDAILYELRDRALGLHTGRWDYLFSLIKFKREDPAFVLGDRDRLTPELPLLDALGRLIVQTCHRRGTHALGGLSPVIVSRTDTQANRKALRAVGREKRREALDGYDGTWVAHPALVAVAAEQFDAVLGGSPHQIGRVLESDPVAVDELLAVEPDQRPTPSGLRKDVNVAIQYISSWLRGRGAGAIHGVVAEAATAEIARSQVWQWVRHRVPLSDGSGPVTPELVRRILDEELERIRLKVSDDDWWERWARPHLSRELFEQVALSGERFVSFLTLPAYAQLLALERSQPD